MLDFRSNWFKYTLSTALIGCLFSVHAQSASLSSLLNQSPAVQSPSGQANTQDVLKSKFDNAVKLQKAGKLNEALAAFKALDKIKPNNPAVILNIGLTYRLKNDNKSAISAFQRMLKLDPKNAFALMQMTTINLQTGAKQEALEYAQKLAAAYPKEFQAQSLLGIAYLENNDIQKGITVLRRAHNLKPDDISTLTNLLRASMRIKDYKAALEFSNDLLVFTPKDGQLRMTAAYAAEKCGNNTAAIRHYEAASSLPGFQVPALMELGRLYGITGKDAKSTNAIKRLLKYDKNNYQANMILGRKLYMTNNLTKAEPYFAAAQKSNPTSAEPAMFTALIKIRTKHPDDAFKYAQSALNKAPKNKSVLEVYTYVQENRKMYENAIDTYRKWLTYYPEDTFIHQKIVNLLMIQMKPDLATAEYETAFKKNPKDFYLAISYADLLYTLQNFEKSYSMFETALKIKPQSADAAIGSANCLQKLGKQEDASKLLEALVVKEPKNERAGLALAGLYRDQNNNDKAIEQYKRVLEKFPKNSQALTPLAEIYEQQKNYDEAIETYRKLVIADPKNPIYAVKIVNLLNTAGKLDLAIDEARKLVSSNPKDTNYRAILADMLTKKDDLDGALSEYAEMSKSDDPSEQAYAHYKAGDLRVKQDKNDLAYMEYKQAIDVIPDYSPALTALEDLSKKDKKQDELYTYLKSLVEQAKEQSPYAFYYHALRRAGKSAEAVTTLESIVAGNPKIAAVHSTLAVAYVDANQTDKAIQEYKTILENKPDDSKTNKSLGELLLKSGKEREAVKYLEEAAKQMQLDRQLLKTIAQTYEKLGERSKAVSAYRNYLRADPSDQEAKNKLRDLETVKPSENVDNTKSTKPEPAK